MRALPLIAAAAVLLMLLMAASGADANVHSTSTSSGGSSKSEEDSCTADGMCDLARPRRFLLYSINPGEGFNLARDIYLRIAKLMLELKSADNGTRWTLVLPPFSNPHWQTQADVPWSNFFDLSHLRKLIDVVELDEFLDLRKRIPVIDHVLHLENLWLDGKWEPQVVPQETCNFDNYPGAGYNNINGEWRGRFFGRGQHIAAAKLTCFKAMGDVTVMVDTLKNTSGSAVMIARGETLLHKGFGDKEFWRIRRSMVFASALRQEAKRFREKVIGVPYLGVHMRRSDFVAVRQGDIPSIAEAVKQISDLVKKHSLKAVFLATDARSNDKEFQKMFKLDVPVYRYPSGLDILNKEASASQFNDGERAVIDQLLCINADIFLGSLESTFTGKIREERQFIRKETSTTQNSLCPSDFSKHEELKRDGTNCISKESWPAIKGEPYDRA